MNFLEQEFFNVVEANNIYPTTKDVDPYYGIHCEIHILKIIFFIQKEDE